MICVDETIETNVAAGLDIEVILDNYAPHKHPEVTAWLGRHPRVHFHFTPTSSSWLNLVERWFGMLTDKALRRGVFHSVPDLVTAIEDYLATHNDDPRPLVWTASAQHILDKIAPGRVALNQATNSETHERLRDAIEIQGATFRNQYASHKAKQRSG